MLLFNQPVSTERNIPISSDSVFQVRQIPCQLEVKKLPHNVLYMNEMAPRSENSQQHLAAFILKFLNTSVQLLGSNRPFQIVHSPFQIVHGAV